MNSTYAFLLKWIDDLPHMYILESEIIYYILRIKIYFRYILEYAKDFQLLENFSYFMQELEHKIYIKVCDIKRHAKFEK